MNFTKSRLSIFGTLPNSLIGEVDCRSGDTVAADSVLPKCRRLGGLVRSTSLIRFLASSVRIILRSDSVIGRRRFAGIPLK